MQNLARIAGDRAEEGAIAIHHDETELVVGGEQILQRLGVKLVVAKVEGCIDRLEWFEVDGHLLFFVVVGENSAAVND